MALLARRFIEDVAAVLGCIRRLREDQHPYLNLMIQEHTHGVQMKADGHLVGAEVLYAM